MANVWTTSCIALLQKTIFIRCVFETFLEESKQLSGTSRRVTCWQIYELRSRHNRKTQGWESWGVIWEREGHGWRPGGEIWDGRTILITRWWQQEEARDRLMTCTWETKAEVMGDTRADVRAEVSLCTNRLEGVNFPEHKKSPGLSGLT